MVCLNVFIIYPAVFAAPQFLRSMYNLNCSMYCGIFVCHKHCRWRKVHVGKCADTWYKQIDPSKTVELSGLATCHHAYVKQWMSWLYCYCDVHIDIGATLNFSRGAARTLSARTRQRGLPRAHKSRGVGDSAVAPAQCLHVSCWMLSSTMQRHNRHCWLIPYAKVSNWAIVTI